MNFKHFIILAVVIVTVNCQLVVGPGPCKPKPGIPGTFARFDNNAWHRSLDSNLPDGGKCFTGSFLTMINGTTKIIRHFIDTDTNVFTYEDGYVQTHSNPPGSFELHLPFYPATAKFTLVDWTPKAATIFYCLDNGNGTISEGAIVWTSLVQYAYESEVQDRSIKALKNIGFTASLKYTDNTNCDKFIEP